MGILRKIGSFLIDSVQTFLMAAAVFLVIYIFFFRPFEVKGESMVPNFLDSQYVLTNLITLRFNNPKLGDVIVFKAPTDNEKDFIKRVIGVPGDTVEVKDGSVYLNGNLLDQSKFLKPDVKTYEGSFLKEGVPVTVPSGNYFVMGDNRLYSSDSREWGFVSKGALIGESFFVYWPANQVKLVKNPYTN
jgi:signal peptidase I